MCGEKRKLNLTRVPRLCYEKVKQKKTFAFSSYGQHTMKPFSGDLMRFAALVNASIVEIDEIIRSFDLTGNFLLSRFQCAHRSAA